MVTTKQTHKNFEFHQF